MTIARLMSICFYMAIGVFTVYLASRVKTNDSTTSHAKALEKTYLTGIFLVLFLCSALRFDIGNDYGQYTQTAHEAFVGGYVVTEIGFNYLVKAVYFLLGGEYYEVIFAIFAFATIWIFLKAMYEQCEDFFFCYFLFMAFGFYFQTYNTVRYYFALAIALYCMKFVMEKDYIRFVLWVLLAALFHKSVLIIIPVYLLASVGWKKWHIIVGVVLSGICYLAKGPVLALMLKLYPSYRNTIYLDNKIQLFPIVRIMAVVGFYLWFCWKYGWEQEIPKEARQKISFYGQLNILALDVSVFFAFLPVVTRIIYYFSVSQLLMIPAIVHVIPEEKTKKLVKRIIIIACVAYFLLFLLDADKAGVGLLPYKSWLFNNMRYKYK